MRSRDRWQAAAKHTRAFVPPYADSNKVTLLTNRQFPEITGKDNLTVFSDSGKVKSPEWRCNCNLH